ncbi:MAG: hypothetical protein HZB39_20990 [Planctomycetes bacterium]|nr:hypothetical protein [Planctomycetota bacterium]
MRRLGTLALVALIAFAVWRVQTAEPLPEVVRVRVDFDGNITVSGQPCTLAEARDLLSSYIGRSAEIWYQREESEGRPHKTAMLLLDAIAGLGLPISLSTVPDFGDVILANGSVVPRVNRGRR